MPQMSGSADFLDDARSLSMIEGSSTAEERQARYDRFADVSDFDSKIQRCESPLQQGALEGLLFKMASSLEGCCKATQQHSRRLASLEERVQQHEKQMATHEEVEKAFDDCMGRVESMEKAHESMEEAQEKLKKKVNDIEPRLRESERASEAAMEYSTQTREKQLALETKVNQMQHAATQEVREVRKQVEELHTGTCHGLEALGTRVGGNVARAAQAVAQITEWLELLAATQARCAADMARIQQTVDSAETKASVAIAMQQLTKHEGGDPKTDEEGRVHEERNEGDIKEIVERMIQQRCEHTNSAMELKLHSQELGLSVEALAPLMAIRTHSAQDTPQRFTPWGCNAEEIALGGGSPASNTDGSATQPVIAPTGADLETAAGGVEGSFEVVAGAPARAEEHSEVVLEQTTSEGHSEAALHQVVARQLAAHGDKIQGLLRDEVQQGADKVIENLQSVLQALQQELEEARESQGAEMIALVDEIKGDLEGVDLRVSDVEGLLGGLVERVDKEVAPELLALKDGLGALKGVVEEQVGSLSQCIQRLDAEIHLTKSQVEGMNEKLEATENHLQKIQFNLGTVERGMDTLESNLEGVEETANHADDTAEEALKEARDPERIQKEVKAGLGVMMVEEVVPKVETTVDERFDTSVVPQLNEMSSNIHSLTDDARCAQEEMQGLIADASGIMDGVHKSCEEFEGKMQVAREQMVGVEERAQQLTAKMSDAQGRVLQLETSGLELAAQMQTLQGHASTITELHGQLPGLQEQVSHTTDEATDAMKTLEQLQEAMAALAGQQGGQKSTEPEVSMELLKGLLTKLGRDLQIALSHKVGGLIDGGMTDVQRSIDSVSLQTAKMEQALQSYASTVGSLSGKTAETENRVDDLAARLEATSTRPMGRSTLVVPKSTMAPRSPTIPPKSTTPLDSPTIAPVRPAVAVTGTVVPMMASPSPLEERRVAELKTQLSTCQGHLARVEKIMHGLQQQGEVNTRQIEQTSQQVHTRCSSLEQSSQKLHSHVKKEFQIRPTTSQVTDLLSSTQGKLRIDMQSEMRNKILEHIRPSSVPEPAAMFVVSSHSNDDPSTGTVRAVIDANPRQSSDMVSSNVGMTTTLGQPRRVASHGVARLSPGLAEGWSDSSEEYLPNTQQLIRAQHTKFSGNMGQNMKSKVILRRSANGPPSRGSPLSGGARLSPLKEMPGRPQSTK